jgi:hypothetical protein
MRKKEGIIGTAPAIDKISFELKGKMNIYLEDGRILIVPLSLFPSIKKLSESQRKKWHISDAQIILFADCDEVFHLEQFLGSEVDYRYSFV